MSIISNNTEFIDSPGDVLRKILKEKDVKQKDFAKKIHTSYTVLNKYINGNRPMNASFALILEKSLDIKAEYWLQLQAQYDIHLARQKTSLIKKLYLVEIV